MHLFELLFTHRAPEVVHHCSEPHRAEPTDLRMAAAAHGRISRPLLATDEAAGELPRLEGEGAA